jgi:hypothetical protein
MGAKVQGEVTHGRNAADTDMGSRYTSLRFCGRVQAAVSAGNEKKFTYTVLLKRTL